MSDPAPSGPRVDPMLLVVFVGALGIRLGWNLWLHPLWMYVDNDMLGYVIRAEVLLRDGLVARSDQAFFPAGTHLLVAAIQWVTGSVGLRDVAVVWAVLGAGTVVVAAAIAKQLSSNTWVAPTVGCVLAMYWPHVALGGFVLSEVPFGFCLVLLVWATLRLADGARVGWVAGLAAGLALWIRPQVVLSLLAMAVAGLLARRRLRFRLSELASALIAFSVFVALGVAWPVYHTGRPALVSQNGTFNLVMGRCHNTWLVAMQDDGMRPQFSAPPFFAQTDQKLLRAGLVSVELNPAMGEWIRYEGQAGDSGIHLELIRQCVDKTGLSGQLAYSWVNVRSLWGYMAMWPPVQYNGALLSLKWTRWTSILVGVPGLLLAVGTALRIRQRPRLALVAAPAWGLIAVAALVFGMIRLRVPYDPLLVVLLVTTLGEGVSWARNARDRPGTE